jgi:hypothetical protein
MVTKELRSGQQWRLWRGEFPAEPPFPCVADAILVAYYASAELGCFRALNWSQPANVLDPYELRNRVNGLVTPAGSGLVGYPFLRRVTFPAEDRLLLTSAPYRGGYRWFRSDKIVDLEQRRAAKATPIHKLMDRE